MNRFYKGALNKVRFLLWILKLKFIYTLSILIKNSQIDIIFIRGLKTCLKFIF